MTRRRTYEALYYTTIPRPAGFTLTLGMGAGGIFTGLLIAIYLLPFVR